MNGVARGSRATDGGESVPYVPPALAVVTIHGDAETLRFDVASPLLDQMAANGWDPARLDDLWNTAVMPGIARGATHLGHWLDTARPHRHYWKADPASDARKAER